MLTGLLYAMKGEIESLLPPDAAPERTEAGVLFYRPVSYTHLTLPTKA